MTKSLNHLLFHSRNYIMETITRNLACAEGTVTHSTFSWRTYFSHCRLDYSWFNKKTSSCDIIELTRAPNGFIQRCKEGPTRDSPSVCRNHNSGDAYWQIRKAICYICSTRDKPCMQACRRIQTISSMQQQQEQHLALL